ncbi:MAG: DNA (cytosine-5-)-methyltransferase [Proteobacteria bacterium]|nr:DNA (cytosine-5-)-methyltransferase [Pseudomonadota bacterium]
MKVLDLFSGIGGFSLGLERAGMETVAFCEIEPYCQKVLKKHWPNIPIYEDVRNVTKERLGADGIFPDIITGGFPCQDISTAGKQRGLEGERSGLWSEIRRLISELQPRFVIVENVSALLTGPSESPGRWFGRILGDLAECGYDAEWQNIPAAAVGAPHRRERVWILAYPCKVRWSEILENCEKRSHKTNNPWAPFFMASRLKPASEIGGVLREPALFSSDDGISDRLARLGACGNAVVPQIPEIIGRAIMEIESEPKDSSPRMV